MKNKSDSSDDCFKHQNILLKLFGFSTNQNVFYKIYFITLSVILIIYSLGVIREIFKLKDDIDDLTNTILFQIGYWNSLISMHILYWNRFKLEKLFKIIKTVNKLSISNNMANNDILLIPKYKNLIKKQSYIGTIISAFIIESQVLIPILLSINKKEWPLPFGNGLGIYNRNIELIIQVILYNIIAWLYLSIFFVYYNMLTFLSGHCKQLQQYLSTILIDETKKSIKKVPSYQSTNSLQYSGETKIIDWETFKIRLKAIVCYHIGIIEAAVQIENVFTYIILVIFGGTVITMCLLIFHITICVNISYIAFMKDLMLIMVGYLLIILLSIMGEQVITESSKILRICYDVDFIGTDLRIQRSLLIIMIRAQKPLTLTIGKIKVLNMNTILSIYQTSYSYYTFLSNMGNRYK